MALRRTGEQSDLWFHRKHQLPVGYWLRGLRLAAEPSGDRVVAVAVGEGLDSGLTSKGGLAAGGLGGGRLREKEESGKAPRVSGQELEGRSSRLRWESRFREGLGTWSSLGDMLCFRFLLCSPHFWNCCGLKTEAEGKCISTFLGLQTKPSYLARTTW